MSLSPACAVRLSAYCDVACPLVKSHGALVAAFGGSVLSKEERAWRCYAKSALDASGAYREFSSDYCTRHAVLSALRDDCEEQEQRAQPSTLAPWPADPAVEVTLTSVDAEMWQPSEKVELLRVHAWQVPCIDDVKQHALRNRTKNVSVRKAFLSREGLKCYGTCVRGVVDGFATEAELAPLLAMAPRPTPENQGGNIKVWRWTPPEHPAIFRQLVARAQTVLEEQYGARHTRFYRSNMITWHGVCKDGPRACPGPKWPTEPIRWVPTALHGDTNTDEMFLYTTILYLSQHGAEVRGGETAIADVVLNANEPPGEPERVTAGLRVQPSIGRLLVFSSGVENMHEMIRVSHGTRVAIQFWFACEDMKPGWARPQRIAWEAEHGWGGPDGPQMKDDTPPPMSFGRPWPWRPPRP